MTVRIYNESVLHFAIQEDWNDKRLAWTRCGIKFAWGEVPGVKLKLSKCRICFNED